jgi:hypothetical protein
MDHFVGPLYLSYIPKYLCPRLHLDQTIRHPAPQRLVKLDHVLYRHKDIRLLFVHGKGME